MWFIYFSNQSIPYLSLDSVSLSLLVSSTGLHRFWNDEQGTRTIDRYKRTPGLFNIIQKLTTWLKNVQLTEIKRVLMILPLPDNRLASITPSADGERSHPAGWETPLLLSPLRARAASLRDGSTRASQGWAVYQFSNNDYRSLRPFSKQITG